MMEELGRMLRAAREEKGISLAQIAETTRIQRRYLESIEAGAFDNLPGPVYVRAFLRHYARAVGIDPEYVIDQYRHLQGLQGVEEKEETLAPALSVSRYRQARLRRPTQRARQARWILACVAILCVAAAGVYVAGEQRRLNDPVVETGELPGVFGGTGASQSNAGSRIEPPGGSLAQVRPPASDATPRSEQGSVQDHHPVGLVRPQALEERAEGIDFAVGLDSRTSGRVVPESAASGIIQAFEALEAMGATDASDREDTGALSGESAETAPGVVLLVEVTERCWFEVYADGRRIFTGSLQPGTVVTWVAEELLRVRFGRPEGVYLTLNGTPLGRAGTGVITREFRRDGTG